MDNTSSYINTIVAPKLRYSKASDVGRRREENQDSLCILEVGNDKLFIVADGMGGVRGGAIASQLAVKVFTDILEKYNYLSEKELVEAATKANLAIFNCGVCQSEYAGMGTTVVGLCFHCSRLLVLNVGDSRAYRLRGDELTQLTEDHTLVAELVKAGTLQADKVENHPVSHMLTRSLGPAPSVDVDCYAADSLPKEGDRYIICSDGLYNMVKSEQFISIMKNSMIENLASDMIEAANQNGGLDNVTCIAIEFDGLEELAGTYEFMQDAGPNVDSKNERNIAEVITLRKRQYCVLILIFIFALISASTSCFILFQYHYKKREATFEVYSDEIAKNEIRPQIVEQVPLEDTAFDLLDKKQADNIKSGDSNGTEVVAVQQNNMSVAVEARTDDFAALNFQLNQLREQYHQLKVNEEVWLERKKSFDTKHNILKMAKELYETVPDVALVLNEVRILAEKRESLDDKHHKSINDSNLLRQLVVLRREYNNRLVDLELIIEEAIKLEIVNINTQLISCNEQMNKLKELLKKENQQLSTPIK